MVGKQPVKAILDQFKCISFSSLISVSSPAANGLVDLLIKSLSNLWEFHENVFVTWKCLDISSFSFLERGKCESRNYVPVRLIFGKFLEWISVEVWEHLWKHVQM